MKHKNHSFALGVLLLGIYSPLQAAPKTPSQPTLNSLAALRKSSVQQLIDTVEMEAKKPRRSLNDDMRLNAAISLLGDYRAVEAVSFLVKNVDLEANTINLSLVAFANLPSVNSLIKIGNPSVDAILNYARQDSEISEHKLRLFAYVIRSIDGTDVGLYRLQLASKSATGTQKINLLNLIDVYNRNESGIEVWKATVEGDNKPVDQ